ncbi:MAG TPA: Na-translocating system protein MpsC family protein [Solirubrobacteraceae bacterium]|jgi:uncharacterized protein YbcI|nr:Na-translocating system protein MpsC family protein [Solirubrobacteraceae bacterium]
MVEQNTKPDDLLIEEPITDRIASRSLEVSNAISRLHKQFIGRGPTNSRTAIDGNLVVCLLEGGFTRAEQTLNDNDKQDLVVAGRVGLQESMRQAMIAAVEEITGRRVRSFMSANDLEHDLQTEIFVLSSEDVENTDHLDI